MTQDITTFSYDFNKSYYENFLSNRLGGMRNSGQFYEVYDRLWQSYDTTTTIDGVIVNNGVDVKEFVQQVYNGTVPLCMVDALGRAIADAIGGIFGCGVGKAIFAVIDWFTDLFGSFICTATVESLGTECGTDFLKQLKDYRDDEMMTYKEGKDMVRYYGIVGPKVVKAIEADKERATVYLYLWTTYILPLGIMVENNDKSKVIYIYFKMLDEMVTKYDIKVSTRFDNWVEESLEKYIEEVS